MHIKLYTLLIYLGYHFYSRRDGTTTQHRKLLEVGAHAKPYNRCSIGICYEGGRDEQGRFRDTRTPEQKESMNDLVIMMRKLFPNAMVVGHREMICTLSYHFLSIDDIKAWLERRPLSLHGHTAAIK